MKLDRSWWAFGFFAVLLALAPFNPEPHLFGKIRWIAGGAVGMQTMDWFDFFMHGGPISFFLIVLIIKMTGKSQDAQRTQ